MLSIWANKSYIHLCQQNYHQALIMAENILKSDLMITPGIHILKTIVQLIVIKWKPLKWKQSLIWKLFLFTKQHTI